MMLNATPQADSTAIHTPLEERFYAASKALTILIDKLTEMNAAPITIPLQYFKVLDQENQERVTLTVETILTTTFELIREGYSPLNTKLLVTRFMNNMGLSALSDVFLTYKDGDLIDMYNNQNQMIFASLNLFALSAYNIEELLCRPWTELWHRDSHIIQQLMEKTLDVLFSDEKKTMYMSIPVHQVVELTSAKKNTAWVHCKIFSPIMSSEGRTAGFLAINELRSKVWSASNRIIQD